MKKTFAVFCALVLMPMFNAQAWIGGPFSNNNFFGENGDDGVYEAAASRVNGVGLFRFVVGNNFSGAADILTAAVDVPVFDDDGNVIAIIGTVGINSGNTIFGGFGQDSNIWFYKGVAYRGRTTGTVNSVAGTVHAVGTAIDEVTNISINSSFKATLNQTGRSLPVSSFNGRGRGNTLDPVTGATSSFRFQVFGTKVSSQILYGI